MALFSLDSNDLNTELNYKKCYINCMIVQIQDRNKDEQLGTHTEAGDS